MKIFTVYGLVDPRGPEVFYVGCTSRLDCRFAEHVRQGSAKVKTRIQGILSQGLKPSMVILEYTADALREFVWIDLLLPLGLVNSRFSPGPLTREQRRIRARERKQRTAYIS